MYLEELPKWTSKAREQLNNSIKEICIENNINISFVNDSKGIEDCKNEIIARLINISNNVEVNANQPNYPNHSNQPNQTFEEVDETFPPLPQLWHDKNKKKKGRPKGSTFSPEMKGFMIEARRQHMKAKETAQQMNDAFPELNGTMTGGRVRQTWYNMENARKVKRNG